MRKLVKKEQERNIIALYMNAFSDCCNNNSTGSGNGSGNGNGNGNG